jgi:hypothetical protein
MSTKELIQTELDTLSDEDLEALYTIIKHFIQSRQLPRPWTLQATLEGMEDVESTTLASGAPGDRLCGDQTEDEEQTPLLKRYHELVDKQLLESLSDWEKDELDALKSQLDEIDESHGTLQRADARIDARRQLFDEQLDKISEQLKALLEQM